MDGAMGGPLGLGEGSRALGRTGEVTIKLGYAILLGLCIGGSLTFDLRPFYVHDHATSVLSDRIDSEDMRHKAMTALKGACSTSINIGFPIADFILALQHTLPSN